MIGSFDQTKRSGRSVPESADAENLVVVGRIRRTTGIDGMLLVEVYSGDPDRFSAGDLVIVDGSQYEIVKTGKSGKSAKIKLAGIDSIEEADLFRDAEVSVAADTLPENPPGVYYHYEILGIDVVTTDGQQLGTLTEIIETGSNDVFVVSQQQQSTGDSSGKKQKHSGELLIPVLKDVIIAVDKELGVMTLDPPAGLF